MMLQKSDNEDDNSPISLADIKIYQEQYNQHFRQLKYYGLSLLPDEDAVLDLIQDIWLRIWKKKDTYRNEIAFKHYLFRSLHNAILNYLKHNKVASEYVSSVSEQDAIEPEISHKIIESEIYQAVNQIFDELPNACRKVYAASLEGKTQKEISEQFNISINTVKKHINNANHYMRKRVKDFLLFFISLS